MNRPLSDRAWGLGTVTFGTAMLLRAACPHANISLHFTRLCPVPRAPAVHTCQIPLRHTRHTRQFHSTPGAMGLMRGATRNTSFRHAFDAITCSARLPFLLPCTTRECRPHCSYTSPQCNPGSPAGTAHRRSRSLFSKGNSWSCWKWRLARLVCPAQPGCRHFVSNPRPHPQAPKHQAAPGCPHQG